MRAKFLKNLLWLQLLNWLVKPLWILWIEREIQLRMGDEWYGVYSLHFNLTLLFAVLLDAGLNTYVSKEIAAHGKLYHPKRMLFLRFSLGLIYVGLILLVADLQAGIQGVFLFYALINQLMASVILMLRSVLQGKQRFVSDSWLSVADRLVALVACSWMLRVYTNEMFHSEGGVLMFQLAQFFGYLAALVLGLVLVFWKSKRVEVVVDVSNEGTYQWLKQLGWYAVMALAMSVFTRIDVQMIQRYAGGSVLANMELPVGLEISKGWDIAKYMAELGYREIGLYAKGYRLLDAALIFSTLLSTQLLPLLSAAVSKRGNTQDLMHFGLRVVLMVSVGAAFGCWFYGDAIMNWLYQGEMVAGATVKGSGFSLALQYGYSGEILHVAMIFKVLMIAFIPMSLVHVFGTYVTAAGHMKWLAKLAVVCVAVNVIFNYIEIPKVGALAAAVGCLITQTVFAAACIVKTHRLGGYIWSEKQAQGFFAILVGGMLCFGLTKMGLKFTGLGGFVLSGIVYSIIVGWLLFRKDIGSLINIKK